MSLDTYVYRCEFAMLAGIFRAKQNRGFPAFATDEAKDAILQLGLRGIGFYPAGRVID